MHKHLSQVDRLIDFLSLEPVCMYVYIYVNDQLDSESVSRIFFEVHNTVKSVYSKKMASLVFGKYCHSPKMSHFPPICIGKLVHFFWEFTFHQFFWNFAEQWNTVNKKMIVVNVLKKRFKLRCVCHNMNLKVYRFGSQ